MTEQEYMRLEENKKVKIERLKKAQSSISDAWLQIRLVHPQIDSSEFCKMRNILNTMELDIENEIEKIRFTPNSELN